MYNAMLMISYHSDVHNINNIRQVIVHLFIIHQVEMYSFGKIENVYILAKVICEPRLDSKKQYVS